LTEEQRRRIDENRRLAEQRLAAKRAALNASTSTNHAPFAPAANAPRPFLPSKFSLPPTVDANRPVAPIFTPSLIATQFAPENQRKSSIRATATNFANNAQISVSNIDIQQAAKLPLTVDATLVSISHFTLQSTNADSIATFCRSIPGASWGRFFFIFSD
jgi:hypothetical protein